MNLKCIVSLLAAMLCVGHVQAQQETSRKTQWSIAPRAGVNFATRAGGDRWVTGFHADVLGQCRFSNVWALEFGLSYSQEGYRGSMYWNETGVPKQQVWYKERADVLNIPVTVKAYLLQGLSLAAGGELKVGDEVGAGVVLGLGYELPVGLLFAFDYHYGTPYFGSKLGGGIAISQVCQLSVGWRFGLSKR